MHNPETLLNPLHPLPPPPSEAPVPEPIASVAIGFMKAILGDAGFAHMPPWPPLRQPQQLQVQLQQPLLQPALCAIDDEDEYDDAFWTELDAVVESGRSNVPSTAPLEPAIVVLQDGFAMRSSASPLQVTQAQSACGVGTAAAGQTHSVSANEAWLPLSGRNRSLAAEVSHPHAFTVGGVALFTALDQYEDSQAIMHFGDALETSHTTATAAATADRLSAAVQGEHRPNMGALAQEVSAYDTLLTQLGEW